MVSYGTEEETEEEAEVDFYKRYKGAELKALRHPHRM
jgi:hypothetical protein